MGCGGIQHFPLLSSLLDRNNARVTFVHSVNSEYGLSPDTQALEPNFPTASTCSESISD